MNLSWTWKIRISKNSLLIFCGLLLLLTGSLLAYLIYSGSRPKELGEHTTEVSRFGEDERCHYLRGGLETLFLVNKEVGFDINHNFFPPDLVALPLELLKPGSAIMLRKDAASALAQLLHAASQDQLDIRVGSGFRSFKRQKKIFRRKVHRSGLREAKRLSAEPGRSQHQLGTTVDLTLAELKWQLHSRLADTAAGKWLLENAYEFGFVMSYPKDQELQTGYAYEPWHYRFIGVEAALEMKEEGLFLEQYLQRCFQCDESLQCPTMP